MTRFLKHMTIVVVALAPVGHAFAQAKSTSDQQSKYADEALKSCNYDLDHDRFGDYATIDDCVADRTEKLLRQDQAKAAGAHASKPN